LWHSIFEVIWASKISTESVFQRFQTFWGTLSKKVPAIANGGGPDVFISLILSEALLLVRPAYGLSKTACADG
jgi:hypothetical protein